jgi:hypothetical protein
MKTSGWVGLLVAALIGLTSAGARAQERSSNEAERTAGWTILGLGLGLGSGSAMTGAILLAADGREKSVGAATLAGGATTMVVSLITGVALLATDPKPRGSRESSTTLARALSGQFRW